MSIVLFFFMLAFFGVCLYLFNNVVTMDGRVKMVINVLALFFIAWYVLHFLGFLPAPSNVHL